MRRPLAAEALLDLRGWTPEAIERLELGVDGDRVVFPVRDGSGERLGSLRYDPNGGEPKMLAEAGVPRELFPAPELVGEDEGSGSLWLVEGEPDCVRLWSLGHAAVACPGAQNWRAEWAPRFTRRRVVVCFDADEAGRANAARAAGDLAACGIEARLLDLTPLATHEGFDLTDFLARARTESERAEATALLEDMAARAPLALPSSPPEAEPSELRVVTVGEFAAVDEPGAAAILGTIEDALIPESGDVMTYGDGGVGKTSLMLDLGCHLAAGDDWLGIAVPKPRRVLLIENEGPRPRFRRKLRRKLDGWTGSELGDRLLVLERPWGSSASPASSGGSCLPTRSGSASSTSSSSGR